MRNRPVPIAANSGGVRFSTLVLVAICTALFVSLALLAPAALGDTLRVPSEHATIQAAITAAVPGDVVEVAPGTYRENVDFVGKSIRVVAPEGAVIDGGGEAPCVSFRSGEGRGAVLEGFELTNGVGRAHALTTCGGGIFCVGASPTLLRNRIHENRAARGGGAYFEGDAEPRFSENVVEGNTAGDYGGGVAVALGSRALVEANEIATNHAHRGGGVAVVESSALLRDNQITANTAQFRGGGATVEAAFAQFEGGVFSANRASNINGGGGLFCFRGYTGVFDVRFEANEALFNGGGIAVEEGDLYLLECTIRENLAGNSGGGVSARFGTYLTMVRCRVEENRAEESLGGGLSSVDSPVVRVRGGSFASNRAGWGAGGVDLLRCESVLLAEVMIVDNYAYRVGGVRITDFTGRIRNATIVGNRDSSGGYADNVHFYGDTDYTIDNSIIRSNPPRYGDDMRNSGGGPLTVSYSVVGGGWPGEGNMDVDPLFVSYDRGGFDYRLRMDSPCIDRGNDALEDLGPFDTEGEPRRLDGDLDGVAHVDIGADEVNPPVATRFGRVNAVERRLSDALFLNGSAGDERREVTVPAWSPVRLEMMSPPEGPDPARFALYAFLAAPDFGTVAPQPGGLGVAPFPTPLNEGMPQQVAIVWNNLGYEHRLGEADRSSTPSPSVIFDAPHGTRAGATVTFFGIIEDWASTAEGPFSRTNAIVLSVVD